MKAKNQKREQGIFILIMVFVCSSLFAYNLATTNFSKAEIFTNDIPTTILIQNHTFSPKETVIPLNTTVIWKNEDGMSHTVTSDKDLFDSHRIKEGNSFSYQFKTTGTYTYHCKYHKNMVGSIIVK